MKTTKGKWKADLISSGDQKGIENEFGEVVCECKEEHAQLIASAPDLLEACKAIKDSIWYDKDDEQHYTNCDFEDAVKQLQQVIGKAEGK